MRIPGVAVVVTMALLASSDGCRQPTPPLTTYTLSGAVSEMTPAGAVPVGGARIEETLTHQHTTTDGGGFYSLYGLYARTSTFSTSKPGYVTDTRELTISSDARLSIRLRRIAASHSSFHGEFALPAQEAKQP